MEGQQKLSSAAILCVGAGGLGAPALLYLAAAGVGRIGIIEFDSVDLSNLQRQILYTTPVIGQPKALEAQKHLRALNPDIEINVYEAELTADKADELFPMYDIILDGSDNFETKFLINDAAVKHQKPWIYGAIQGFDGQAAVFNTKDAPCYRCLYPEKPQARVKNCAENGVIGAVAGLIGVTQALQAIQLITQHDSFEPLAGKLWTIDTRTMQSRILTIPKNQDCSICSQQPKDIALTYTSPVCGFIPELTIEQARTKTTAVFVDVREPSEWEQGCIDDAVCWPLSKMTVGQIPDIDKNKDIILYCQKGIRSLQAAEIFKNNGFANVYSLSGGFEGWQSIDN